MMEIAREKGGGQTTLCGVEESYWIWEEELIMREKIKVRRLE